MRIMKAAMPTNALPLVLLSLLSEAACHFTRAASENTPLMQSRHWRVRVYVRTCAYAYVCICVFPSTALRNIWLSKARFSLFIRGLLLSAVASEFCFPPDSTKGIYVSCRVCCGLRLEHNWLNMNAYFSSLESRSSPTSISLLLYSFVSLFPGGIGKEIPAREWFKCLKGQIVK